LAPRICLVYQKLIESEWYAKKEDKYKYKHSMIAYLKEGQGGGGKKEPGCEAGAKRMQGFFAKMDVLNPMYHRV
jgi:hypothetical protein